jgi:negative regulator of flagellin synthesis FlgM
MRINGSNLERILAVYKRQGIRPIETGGASEKKGLRRADGVELSQKAMDFKVALKAISEQPEIREQKAASIKASIDAGEYCPKAADIAKRIIDGLLLQKRV